MNFDFEITLLTVSAVDGVHFCAGWPSPKTARVGRADAKRAQTMLALGGYGLFGVELFVCGDEVIFSEVSPTTRHRDGDAYLPDLSEFALHVRAFLGLPVGAIRQYGPAASAVILPQLSSQNVSFGQLQSAVGLACSCVCSASRRLTVPPG